MPLPGLAGSIPVIASPWDQVSALREGAAGGGGVGNSPAAPGHVLRQTPPPSGLVPGAGWGGRREEAWLG